MTLHTLAATPETIVWGRFSANQTPVLTVQPGDTVVIETFNGGAYAFPPEGSNTSTPPPYPGGMTTKIAPREE